MPKTIFPWLVPDDPASLASFAEHAALITHVSPTWYGMDGRGEIASRRAEGVLEIASGRGIGVHPLIVNERFEPEVAHALLRDAPSRARAAEAIAGLALEHGYAGINVDFEGAFGASRDRYTDLLRRLADLLRPAGRWLTVDVFAQTRPADQYPNETSWSAPFDYAALGELCDRVIVMGYDYSMAEPGPLAPRWWLDEVIAHALARIPRERLIIGLPLYGRRWVVRDGRVLRRDDLTHAGVRDLLAATGAPERRDERDQTPRATWRDAEGEHVLHFEDVQTLRANLGALGRAGVDGVALWRLGGENPAVWDAIGEYLEG